MAAGFRFLEHTADVGIEAKSATLAGAFEQAGAGLIALFLDPATVRCTSRRTVVLSGEGTEQLLVRWLSELLYLFDGQKFAPSMTRIHLLDDCRLQASVFGEEFDPERHVTRTDVKAITYHQLSVRREGRSWIATVYVDI